MTSHSLSDALNLELHPAAESAIRERVDSFAISLILEAKRIAYQENADAVMSNHVEQSSMNISTRRGQTLIKQAAQFFGGALFGAFVQGFVTELYAGNTTLIAVYVVFGFIGVGLFTWALMK